MSVAYELKHGIDDVKEELEKMDQVDGISAGASPLTVRWLNSKNKYVNVGLEELDVNSCRILRNNNSYEVEESSLKEIYEAVKEVLAKSK